MADHAVLEGQGSGPNRSQVPYLVFACVGVILILLAAILKTARDSVFADLLLNVGASVTTVVLVEIVWRRYGGDPILSAIGLLRMSLRQLSELDNLGMVAVRPKRDDGVILRWRDGLSRAKQIDLMALTLESEFASKPENMTAIRRAVVGNNCIVRLLTLHPIVDGTEDGDARSRRISEEDLIGMGARRRIEASLERTYGQFAGLVAEDGDQNKFARGTIEHRWTSKLTIYANIIRIDDRIWFCNYLASATGSNSPMFEIAARTTSGSESPLFQLLEREFEHMWKHAGGGTVSAAAPDR